MTKQEARAVLSCWSQTAAPFGTAEEHFCGVCEFMVISRRFLQARLAKACPVSGLASEFCAWLCASCLAGCAAGGSSRGGGGGGNEGGSCMRLVLVETGQFVRKEGGSFHVFVWSGYWSQRSPFLPVSSPSPPLVHLQQNQL